MKNTIIVFILVLFSFSSYAQISHGGEPYSFKNEGLKSIIDYRVLPEIDLETLYMEDEIDENDPDIPWRFGKDIAVDYSLLNSGTWDVLPNGDRIWRLEIISYGAFSINLIYKKFYMPEGATLFLYNPQKTHVIGSFTKDNHKPDGGFATIPVRGERCIIEYYEPAKYKGQGQLEISYVIHAYKDFYASFNKGYGSSGECNVNVNCPEGDEWQNEKRGVAMVLTSNNARKCSGSMINNTAQDGTPYFLTANHCKGGENTWIIMFNYESPNCDNEVGPTCQSVQYSTLRASNTISDFCLVELSVVPPLDYHVYYNGWKKTDEPSLHSACIHHPKGDIKKISFDNNPCVSDKYLGTQGLEGSHWKIEQWDVGTTEPGSSGSPLFNSSHYIIGQLHGGFASCTSLTSDWYGKFSTSWDYGSQENNRLMDWLDPLRAAPDSLNGFYLVDNNYELNAVLLSIEKPDEQYGGPQEISPTFVFRNMGNQSLESLEISYRINNGELVTKKWLGHINMFDTAHITLSPLYLDYGVYSMQAFISQPNGEEDECQQNDTLVKTIHVNYNHDIAIDQFISPSGINCSRDTLQTKFIIKNTGFQNLLGITARLQIDDAPFVEYELERIIARGDTSYFVLDQIIPDEFWHHLTLSVDILGNEDDNTVDNIIETDYSSFGNNIDLQLTTDDAGEEISWKIINKNGEVVQTSQAYESNVFVQEKFCLALGCYRFIMVDSGNDGIQNGGGFVLINSNLGEILGEAANFGHQIEIDFCVENKLHSDFYALSDTVCENKSVKYYNNSIGANSYSWYFEGGDPKESNEVSPTVTYSHEGVYDVSLLVWNDEKSTETVKSNYITVLNCTGVHKIETPLFDIFPNPSNGNFTIELNQEINRGSMRLINQVGEIIYQKNLRSGLRQQFNLPLINGIYVVEIKSAEGLSRQMLLITK